MAGSWEGTGTPDAAVHSFIRTKMDPVRAKIQCNTGLRAYLSVCWRRPSVWPAIDVVWHHRTLAAAARLHPCQ